MSDRAQFMNKLQGILELADKQERQITIPEIENYFEEDDLDNEQMNLVCEYLLSQKVAVKGYKTAGAPDEPKALEAEERKYVEAYLAELDEMKAGNEEEAKMAAYFPKVVEEAVKQKHPQIFIGDVIQEGNISLMLALKKQPEASETSVMEAVCAGMQAFIEEQTEVKRQDNKMVEQVSDLDETLKAMTEELGRKVSMDELAERLGIKESQIEEILKLTGEEAEQ